MKQAKLQAEKMNALRRDPRYQKVIGRLVYEKLLFSKDILPNRYFVTLEEALWVSKIEPRISELLPAILLKRPRLFWATQPPPKDLIQVIKELKKGRAHSIFRGVLPYQYERWLERVGRKGKRPGVLKTFRLKQEDLKMLQMLQKKWNITEISVIRKVLKQALNLS
ncbi:MAG: hypothetical protein HYW47_07715 [Deltaproteobacteria bacterium]|nr:hypothetical protein [Deltaproteobacteria bacterium]